MEGRIFTYTHHDGKLLAWVEVTCQTDFAVKTDEFKKFGDDLAMQVAFENPEDECELLESALLTDEDCNSVSWHRCALEKTLGEAVGVERFGVVCFMAGD